MEPRIPPSTMLPTLFQVNMGLSIPEIPTNSTIVRQAIVSTQPVLVPSQSGHVVVHMQQVVPVLTEDVPLLNLQPCLAYHPANLTTPPLSCHALSPVFPQNAETKIPFCHKIKTKFSSSYSFAKTQKKKKASPSAKRRSRQRLIAFLEAKKEKTSQVHADEVTTKTNPSDEEFNVNSSTHEDKQTALKEISKEESIGNSLEKVSPTEPALNTSSKPCVNSENFTFVNPNLL